MEAATAMAKAEGAGVFFKCLVVQAKASGCSQHNVRMYVHRAHMAYSLAHSLVVPPVHCLMSLGPAEEPPVRSAAQAAEGVLLQRAAADGGAQGDPAHRQPQQQAQHHGGRSCGTGAAGSNKQRQAKGESAAGGRVGGNHSHSVQQKVLDCCCAGSPADCVSLAVIIFVQLSFSHGQ